MSKKKKVLICAISLVIILLLGVSIFLLTGHNHQYGEWEILQHSTCYEQGTKIRTCTVCQKEEKGTLPLAPHTYSDMQSVWIDNANYVEAVCSVCHDASMRYQGGYSIQTGAVHLQDCATDFFFDIVCVDEENVVRENLTIVESMFADADEELREAASDEYILSQLSEDVWRVMPAKPYLECTGYTVILGERVSFHSFPGSTLSFRTGGASEDVAVFNDDILFLHNLETETPGYYPYTIEFDAENAVFHLTVSQQGIFTQDAVGQILCVGECTDMESAVMLDSDAVDVGRIMDINTVDGLTYITLGPVGLEDIYSELDMSLGGKELVAFEEFDEEYRLAFTQAALTSDAFLSSFSNIQAAAEQYAQSIGACTVDVDWNKELDNLLASMEPKLTTSNSGNVTKALLSIGVDNYDIELKVSKDGTHVASVIFSLTFKNQFEILVDGNVNKTNLVEYVKDKVNIFVDKNITAEFHAELGVKSTSTFQFGISFKSALQKNTYYVINPKSGIIHADFCRHATELSQIDSNCLTLPEIKTMFGEDYVEAQCNVCKPFDETKFFVINARNGMVHRGNCMHVSQIDEVNLLQAYIRPTEGEKHGNITYQYCANCSPGNIPSKSFHEFILDTSKNADIEKIYKYTSSMIEDALNLKVSKPDKDTQILKAKLWVFEFGFSMKPTVSMNTQASLDFTYIDITKKTIVFDLRYSQAQKEYVVVSDILDVALTPEEERQVTTSIDVAGSVEIKAGMQFGISLGPAVVSEWFNVRAVLDIGAYADMSLMGHIAFNRPEESYAAGYIDLGLYWKVTTDFTLASHTSKPLTLLPETKFSLFYFGDERIYYGFYDYEQVISLGNQTMIPLDDNLLNTVYYNLRQQQSGTQALSFNTEKQNGYALTITITDANGKPSDDCSIANGVLNVSKGAPDFFTAYMHIVVVDTDPVEWTDLIETKETQSLGFRYDLPELVIEIQYDATSATITPEKTPSEGLEFTSNGDGTCAVTGIGTCADTDVVIPSVSTDGDMVTSVGDAAFRDCLNITSVVIPDSVVRISGYVFSGCTNLTSIIIGSDMVSMGDMPFYGCSNLLSIDVAPDNAQFCSNDGILYNKGMSELVCYPNGRIATAFAVPDSVTSIGKGAFIGCSNLTSIEIPDGVDNIGLSAFAFCTNLTTIDLPQNLSIVNAGLFTSCTSLASITIPENVASIGDVAFLNCSSLTCITIPNSVTRIGISSFDLCTSLSDVYYGGTQASWNSIEIGTSNEALMDATIHFGEGVGSHAHTIEVIPAVTPTCANAGLTEGSFCTDCGKIIVAQQIIVPTGHNPVNDHCTVCGASCKISEGLEYSLNRDKGSYTVIGIGTCTDTEIVIPTKHEGFPVIAIADDAFKGCANLQSIIIPDSVTSIGYRAFYNCQSMRTVTFGQSVHTVGWGAFANCKSLTEVTLPASIKKFDTNTNYEGVFEGCTKLTKVVIGDANEQIELTVLAKEMFKNCTALETVVIGNGIGILNDDAFEGCTNLKEVTLGNSVKTIGNYAFKGCANLQSIIIPDSVTSIGYRAFYNCQSMRTVTFGQSVHTVGWGAFANCKSLTEVTLPASIKKFDTNTNYEGVFEGCTKLTKVVIGDANEQIELTVLAKEMFKNCTALETVVIGNGVGTIGERAFDGCTSLTNIVYKGTVARWNAMLLGSNWNRNVPAIEVICSDGAVRIKD